VIKRVIIQNFQSHRDTTIDFSDKDTVIVGSSDSGKSAILRAIEWVRTNRPLGTSFIRNGANSPCRVELIVDRDGEEVSIVHEKTTKRNSYYVNGQEFTAVGSDVPREVVELLGIADINVQHQLDQHFLVLDSPGRVASYINSITKLEDASEVQARIVSELRELTKEIEEKKGEIARLEEEEKKPIFQALDDFSFLIDRGDELLKEKEESQEKKERIQKCIQDLQFVESSLFQINRKVELLSSVETLSSRFTEIRESHQERCRKLSRLKVLSSGLSECVDALVCVCRDLDRSRAIESICSPILVVSGDLSSVEKLRQRLESLVRQLKDSLDALSSTERSIRQKEMLISSLSSLGKIRDDYSEVTKKNRSLSRLVMSIRESQSSLCECEKSLDHLRSQRKDFLEQIEVCPLCNAVLDDDRKNHVMRCLDEDSSLR
jgi:exonuclease SbcC